MLSKSILLSDSFVRGDYNLSATIASEILKKDPLNEQSLKIISFSFNRLGRYLEGSQKLKSLLALTPFDAEAWNEMGVCYSNINNKCNAKKAYRNATVIRPQYIAGLCNLGNELRKLGNYPEAVFQLRRALLLDPSLVEPVYNLALSLSDANRIDESIASYRRSVQLSPRLAIAWNNYALLLIKKGDINLAVFCLKKSINIDTYKIMPRINLASILMDQKEFESSYNLIITAIILEPNNPQAYGVLGNLMRMMKKTNQAESAYTRSIVIDPYLSELHSNHGNLLRDKKDLRRSLSSLIKSVVLSPACTEAYYNLGVTYYRMGDEARANHAYIWSTTLNPSFAESHLAQAFLLLSQGRFEDGFKLYEWRYKHPDFGITKKESRFPEWDGKESIEGKTMLIYSEQGYGDTIQFSRFAELLEKRRARVILQVQEPLKELLSGIGKNINVISEYSISDKFDLQAPLMSLPYLLQLSSSRIPPPPRALYPKNDSIRKWSKKLGKRRKPRIGLVFRGNPQHVNDDARSIPWNAMNDLLSDEFEFYCIEKDIRDEDLDFISSSDFIISCNAYIFDFEDTASLCLSMDLVITVDTSVAHLSASLGVQTWILLMETPDWRWQYHIHESPWYPSVRLFRKDIKDDWRGFVNYINAEMRYFLGKRPN